MPAHIIHNGELMKNQAVFTAEHPLVQGTNSLRFQWFVMSSMLPFYQDEFRRICEFAEKKGLRIPSWMTGSTFAQDIHHLFQMNRIYQGGLLNMIIYADSPSEEASYIMTAEARRNKNFILNEEGLLIDVFRKHRLYSQSAEIYDTGLSPTETSALFDMHKGMLQQMVILNEHFHVARFVGANFLMTKNETVYTPAIEEGALDDIMRQKTIEACLNLNMKVFADCILHINDIKSADEIMVLHPVRGIQWVVGFEEKRFYRRTSPQLMKEINRLFFGE
jgi:branched-chain amino acid aminotransferase